VTQITPVGLQSAGSTPLRLRVEVAPPRPSSRPLGEVLVRGAPGVAPVTLSSELAPLAARFPGLTVASRSVVNAQAQVYLAQQSYGNELFLGIIVLLAAVALVNTLVMATVERRGALFLLRRVGATTRQLLSMTIWQTVILDLTGLILGVAAGAASVVVVSKQLAGTWMPYLTWPPMAVIGATVVGLTIIAILAPTLWLLASPIRAE
jgi:putative ABC transport system permease protein